ncbi:MAG: transglutaminase family protein, partial [Deltaproteobacteria bacterium]|nr:transglutaminase family protein [Deltaproteobacteria bacterium]
MLFSIQHSTILRYSRPISESVLEVRVTPRSDSRQTLRQFHLAVGPDARVTSHLDWLGNPVHQFSVLLPHDRVVVHATSTVETHAARTDPSRLVDLLVADTPRHRFHDWLSFQGPVRRDARLVALAERLRLGQCARVIDAVEVVTARTRDVLEYRRGMTHAASSVSEALDAGAGVCQDFAHVGVALLRLAGVPAR